MSEKTFMRIIVAVAFTYAVAKRGVEHSRQTEAKRNNWSIFSGGYINGEMRTINKSRNLTILDMEGFNNTYVIDQNSRTLTVTGYLPVRIKENATYVFAGGVIVEDCWGEGPVSFIYDKKSGTNIFDKEAYNRSRLD
jgi:hypothetical protein